MSHGPDPHGTPSPPAKAGEAPVHADPHLEEAEHARHASHDPFDRRVAMTMVIVAAVLAALRLLGHRAHNDTLRYQILADVHHTQESDQWNFFQAQKMRQHLYQSQSDLLQALAANNSQASPDTEKRLKDWQAQAERYLSKSEKIKEEAEKEKEEAKHQQAESERMHHRSDWFDLGELGIELALVLCSVAILTKRAAYWYGGVVIGLAGLVVGLLAYLPHRH
jgi:hypothetical protein